MVIQLLKFTLPVRGLALLILVAVTNVHPLSVLYTDMVYCLLHGMCHAIRGGGLMLLLVKSNGCVQLAVMILVSCTRNRVPGPSFKIYYPILNPGNWY